MRRNLIAGLAVAAVAATVLGATVVFGSESDDEVRPEIAQVDVTMRDSAAAPAARAAAKKAKKAKKAKVVYLVGTGTVNTAEPPAGSGRYIDFSLTAPKNQCPRVINGGVASPNTDFYQQGSYVDRGTYHVLMGLDDAAQQTVVPFDSHLICLKGVK
jgi:hypothetical protein